MVRPTAYGTLEQILEIYAGVWGAAADAEGADYWVSRIDHDGWTYVDVADSFFDQARVQIEYRAGGAPLQGDAFLTALYVNIFKVAEADIDAAGFAYWQGILSDMGITDYNSAGVGNLVMQMIDGMWANPATVATTQQLYRNWILASVDFYGNQAGLTPFNDLNAADQAAFLAAASALVDGIDATSTPAEIDSAVAQATNAVTPLSFSLDSAGSVVEGEALTFTLHATKASDVAQVFSIALNGDTLGGTVAAVSPGNDFAGLPTQVTLAAGATAATFSITPTNDNLIEGGEGARVSVFSGATAVASSTFLVNDAAVDTAAPTIAGGQTLYYGSGKAAGTVLGTVVMSDDTAVTAVTIVSGNDDGYFAIAPNGEVTLTAAGAAAGSAANSFNVLPNSFALVITASDGAGNVSAATTVVLAEQDTAPPALTADPTLGNATISLTFDEALDPASIPAGSAFTVLQNGATNVTVSSVTVSGSSVTLGLAAVPTGTVTVSYAPPAMYPLQDLAGNDVAAIANKTVVVDTTPPTLVSSSPADGATSVAINGNLVLTFSESVQAGTGDIRLVSLNGTDNRTIAVTDPQVTISGNTLTINPATDLASGLDYSIQMAAGVLKDISGNAFAGIADATTLNFTTTQPISTELTSGSDIVSGNAFDGTLDILSGQSVETLTNGDRLTGTGTNPTLNVQVQEYAHTITPLSVTGVQTINVDATTLLPTGQAAGAPTLNFANVDASVKNFSVSSQTQAFNLINIASAIPSFSVQNNGGNNFTATFANAALASSGDALALTVNGVTGGAFTFQPTTAGQSGIESLTIASTGGTANMIATLTDGNGTSFTTLNVAGTQDLMIINALDDTVSTINAGGTTPFTGALNVTVGIASGNVAATGGSGNDTFNYDATYTVGDMIDGGDGTNDTLRLNSAQAIVTTAQSNVTNVETIRVGDALNGALNLTHFGALNAVLDTTAAATPVTAAASTIIYTAGTGGLTINNDDTAHTLGATISGSATTDVLNVNLQNADLVFAFTTVGAETVNLKSTIGSDGTAADGAANTATTITLTDTAASEVLNISGDVALTLTGAITANVINASTFTGALTMATATVAPGGAAITGGTNNDTLFGSGANDIVAGGAGNDRIIGSGSQTALVANQADLLTGHAGADTFVFYDTLAGAATVSNATNGSLSHITDFVAGTDKIALITGGPATSINLNTAQTLATAADAAAIIAGMTTIGASVANGALQGAVVTVSAGAAAGTYLYVNDTTAGLSATNDLLIDITGVTGTLTSSDFVFA